MTEKEIGYVYILTNPSFREDWVKIGKSSRPVDIRSKELDNTAVPLPFEIYATMKTTKFNEVEKLVHKSIDRFTDFRIRQNREFFNVPPQTALEIFKDIASTIDDAEITVSGNTEPSAEHTLNSTSPIQETNRHSVHQGTRDRFSINGHGHFPKNGCMLEVIKQQIEGSHEKPCGLCVDFCQSEQEKLSIYDATQQSPELFHFCIKGFSRCICRPIDKVVKDFILSVIHSCRYIIEGFIPKFSYFAIP